MFEFWEALSLGEGTILPMWATLQPLESGLNGAMINQKNNGWLADQHAKTVTKLTDGVNNGQH